MILIGIGGAMESGKDTVGRILCRKYGYQRVSMGDHLRRELAEWRPAPNTLPYVPISIRKTLNDVMHSRQNLWAKPTTESVRIALQWFGQYMRRKNPEYWLDKIKVDIDNIEAEHKDSRLSGSLRDHVCHVVLTDMRMPTEFNYVMDMEGGHTWCMMRARPEPPTDVQSHITESSLQGYPFEQYIANNGSLNDLDKLVGILVREYNL